MIRHGRLLSLVVLVSLAACSKPQGPEPEGTCACAPANAVDPGLLAFLSKARALHHQADLAEEQKDPRGAIAALERILGSPAPARPEVDEVLADTRARLAELRAGQDDFDRAAADVKEGLERAKESTYFRGHLYEVLGVIEEKRAAAMTKSGNETAAREARKRAIDASEQAVKIQDDVIQRSLEKAPR
jgi:hypothetical protein